MAYDPSLLSTLEQCPGLAKVYFDDQGNWAFSPSPAFDSVVDVADILSQTAAPAAPAAPDPAAPAADPATPPVDPATGADPKGK